MAWTLISSKFLSLNIMEVLSFLIFLIKLLLSLITKGRKFLFSVKNFFTWQEFIDFIYIPYIRVYIYFLKDALFIFLLFYSYFFLQKFIEAENVWIILN